MLFKILKLFGINLPAVMAETQVGIEERFDLAKDSLEQAARAATVVTLLFFLASVAAVSAFGVGLIALFRWISIMYGEFYGFTGIGAILLCIAIIILASAISKRNSWRGDSADRAAAKKRELAQARAERIAAATAAFEAPEFPPSSQPSEAVTASDLIEPLVWALSGTTKLPAMRNPAMDALFAHLRSSARGVAGEAVDGLVRTVRHGDRPQLFAALGSAIFVGWLLGRHRPSKVDAIEAQ
jgi:uncharacterized membrane protein